jgi:hypothetical protein
MNTPLKDDSRGDEQGAHKKPPPPKPPTITHRDATHLFKMTPGLSTKSGSNSCFSSHISSVALVPHSISTKGATLRPVPCSPFRLPACPKRQHVRTRAGRGGVECGRLLCCHCYCTRPNALTAVLRCHAGAHRSVAILMHTIDRLTTHSPLCCTTISTHSPLCCVASMHTGRFVAITMVPFKHTHRCALLPLWCTSPPSDH